MPPQFFAGLPAPDPLSAAIYTVRDMPSTRRAAGACVCDYVFPADAGAQSGQPCGWAGKSALDLTLHKSDRHLIYPPGGRAALDALDPIFQAEHAERRRRLRRESHRSAAVRGTDDGDALAVLSGLTVKLDTPEMVDQWIAERKKRWPTPAAVERKRIEDEWRGRDPPRASRVRAPPTQPARPTKTESSSHSSSSSSETSDSDSDSNSSDSSGVSSDINSDPSSSAPPEEVSNKSQNRPADVNEESSDDGPVEETTSKSVSTGLAPPARAVCKFHLQGRCGHGSLCRNAHPDPTGPVGLDQARGKRPVSVTGAGAVAVPAPPPKKPRRRPPPPPVNPFAQPDLLRALLSREIAQHVEATIQAIRFLAKNQWLMHVELQPGLAEAQRKRRNLVQPLEPKPDLDPVPESAAGTSGASPLLRPLTALDWPPEPDPMIFLDPMARDEPKPLKVAQYERLAQDETVREVLAPRCALHPLGRLNLSLARGLQSLLELPSQAHRVAAIELILGTTGQGGAAQPRYTEQDLFRLGLKLGPLEVPLVRALAARVSELLDGAVAYEDDLTRRQTREEELRAEGERRDRLRALGIDVD